MPLNLNVTPYYDDYDESKDFHRVLFRPGHAVQARELTQLQTILQRQIQRHGDHMFEEGSMVIPGHLHFNPVYEYVKLEATHNSVAVTHTNFLNRTIRGLTSGVVAKVVNTAAVDGSDPISLWVEYLNEVPKQTLTVGGASGTYQVGEKVTGTTSGAIGYVDTWTSGTGVLTVRGISNKAAGFQASETVTGATSTVTSTTSSVTALSTNVRLTAGEIIGTIQTATGSAYTGTFVLGEKVTGSASSATGTVSAWNATTKELELDYISGTFTTADTITGTASSATLTVSTLTGTAYGATVGGGSSSSITNAVGTGSAVSIDDGIFYIYGSFVRSTASTLILDKYTNTPSYRVGLAVTETFVASTDDSTLTDNATGAPNYAAPGADRYKISLTLSKLALTSASDQNFIEVMRLDEGQILSKINTTEYAVIEDTLARRTHDESGDYTVTPFDIEVREHLDDGTNRGVYTASQGGDASKLAIAVSPGKAYVHGYEISQIATTYVAVDKPRTTKSVNNSVTSFTLGNYISVNNCYNLPEIDDHVTVHLQNAFTATRGSAAGSQIGTAKVRMIEHTSGTPSGTGATAVFKLYLFDVTMTGSNTFELVKQIYMAGSPAFTCDIIQTSASMTGSVTVSNASTAVVGVGTLFTTEIAVGQWVKIGTSTNKVSAIASNTALTLAANQSGAAAGQPITREQSVLQDVDRTPSIFQLPDTPVKTIRDTNNAVDTTYSVHRQFTGTTDGSGNITITAGSNEVFVAYSNVNWSLAYTNGGSVGNIINISSAITLGGSPTGTTATLAGLAASTGVKILATITKQVAQEKTKTLVSSANLHITSPNTTANGYDVLAKSDIYALVAVHDSGASGTAATTSHTNITSSYELDNGQRDGYYGIGRIKLLPGARAPVGRILIIFSYFNHGTGDYFSANSYTGQIDYGVIPSYTSATTGQRHNLRDCFDFRPRMRDAGDNTTSGGSAFSGTGSSTIEYVQVASSIRADFDFYLPRIDKLYLSRAGDFTTVTGTPHVDGILPANPDDGMVTHTLEIPAYVFSVDDVTVNMIENKRYTMRDIGRIEKRIDTNEYYTALTLLEKDTADLQIFDAKGLDRFKNGFIVDSFTGHGIGDVRSQDYRCSIDQIAGELRPEFVQDNVGLSLTAASSSDYTQTGDLITLPYTHNAVVTQPFASRHESVNPYNVATWVGSIELDPPSDEWRDLSRQPALIVNDDGQFDTMQALATALNPSGTIWNDWQTTWTGAGTNWGNRVITGLTEWRDRNGRRSGRFALDRQVLVENLVTTTQRQTRTGIRTGLVANTVRRSMGDRVVNVAFVRWIRSRDVTFTGTRFKPNTRVYPFFDSVAVSAECLPTGGALGDPLVTDAAGKVTGTFTIPNTATKRFRTGERIFRLSASSTDVRDSSTTTAGEVSYVARGLLQTMRETIVSTREANIVRTNVTDTQTITRTERQTQVQTQTRWVDPLAQTIQIDTVGGAFISKLDLFFQAKSTNIPITVQLRSVVNGYPSNVILPFGEVTLEPNDVNVSSTAATATTFTFSSPVYIQENVEYAIVVLSDDDAYRMWISRIGEIDVGTTRAISSQPYLGSFFKSQNASTWTASQVDDMKFTLYRAKFDTSKTATAVFNNKELGAIALTENPFKTTNASTTVVVSHADHGMPDSPVSKVTISGASTVNGVTAAMLNTTHNVVNADMDSYEIVVSGAANATGHGGGTPSATFNRQMDVMQPIVSQLVFPKTTTLWDSKLTSGRSIHGAETAYALETAYGAVEVNENNRYSFPQMVASTINETTHISGSKSFWLRGRLSSTADNVSPVLDTKRMSIVMVNNRLDTPTSSGTTQVRDFVAETVALGSSTSAKYLTRKVILETDALALKVYVGAVRPSTCTIDCYYKATRSDSTTLFADVAWIQLTQDATIEAATGYNDFREYSYSADDLTPFNIFAIKIVMKGTNTSDVPRITDFRALALGT